MPKPPDKALIIPTWNYACIDCGRCCRHWHVELSPDEEKRLAALKWEPAAAIPAKRTVHIAGGTYIAHHANGDCIYLDTDNHRCRIHREYGYDAKPLGCRLYPFAITPALPERFSCTGRFDCPAVRRNDGRPLRQAIDDIRRFVDELQLTGAFDKELLQGIEVDKARQLVDALIREVIGNPGLPDHERAAGAILAVDRLENLGEVFINDIDLDEILPSFFDRVRQDRREAKIRPLGRFEQLRFLSLLTSFLRRDEEGLHKGMRPRLKRTLTLAKVYFGRPNLHDLGAEHPDAPLDRKLLFGAEVYNARRAPTDLLWDLLRVRLEAMQFFGPALYGLTFFIGLKYLLLLAPLVLALAKWNALVRDRERCEITEDDIHYAVGAIDHPFGRSALLGFGMVTTLVRQISSPEAYARIIDEILRPPS